MRSAMNKLPSVLKRTAVSFYDDQMTHHAAALTYYCLMSLFPVALLSLSLLGLLGQYPATYNSIIGYLRDVAPADVVDPLNSALRSALRQQGTAVAGVAISVGLMLYGTTGALEGARRALNVVFEIESGRSFARRKSIDIAFTFVLIALCIVTAVLVFVGGSFAADLLGFAGFGSTVTEVWGVARWPAAVVVAMLTFSLIYYVVPDVQHRGFRYLTPGAAVGVAIWLAVSLGFSFYISRIAEVGAIYGSFAGAIVLVGWLWLTNVAMLIGAELDAEIERQHELDDGVPPAETLNRPARTG